MQRIGGYDLAQKELSVAAYNFLVIWMGSVAFLALQIPREETVILFITYAVSFFAYFWIVQLTQISWRILVISGIVVRLLLFLDLPNLSDDFYRFIWDGTLLARGINPYGLLPTDVLPQHLPGLDQAYYDQLNSPNYYTIYPPLNQAIFWLSAQLGGVDQLLLSVNVMRLFLLAADIGTALLLGKLLSSQGLNKRWALWYFLNPLVILEFTGNLHFEGLVVFFLVWALYCFESSRTWGQGLGFAGAIATKLIPLIYLPAVLMKQWPRRGIWVCAIAGIAAGITFLPLISSALVSGMSSSIGLYFQSFEFNASIYFIVREIGFAIKGYNLIQQIGPWLGISTFVLITTWSIVGTWRKQSLAQLMLGSLVIYLLLSTTVHPWYVLPLIPLGLVAGYYFPVVWSLLIFLTYMGYSNDPFHLPMGWIAFEYLVVLGTFLVELKLKWTRNET